MIINISDQQKALNIPYDQVKNLVRYVIRSEGYTCDEVNIHFVDTSTICQLHEQFFNDPTPTDCISLPLDPEIDHLPYRILGDVFICPETAIAYATKHHLNPYDETTLYLIHSLLHLMGYDDLTKEERERMRKEEKRYMKELKNLNFQLHTPN